MWTNYRGPIIFSAVGAVLLACLGGYVWSQSGNHYTPPPEPIQAKTQLPQPAAPAAAVAPTTTPEPSKAEAVERVPERPDLRPVAPASTAVEPTAETPAAAAPEAKPAGQGNDPIVYVTRTGAKYHREGCRYLAKSSIPMKLSQAKLRYSPCSVCGPPTEVDAGAGPIAAADKEAPTGEQGTAAKPDTRDGDKVSVKGYYRKDGTYVQPYTRSKPKK